MWAAENAPRNLRLNGGDCSYLWQASGWRGWRFDLAAAAQCDDGNGRIASAAGDLLARGMLRNLGAVGRSIRGEQSNPARQDDP